MRYAVPATAARDDPATSRHPHRPLQAPDVGVDAIATRHYPEQQLEVACRTYPEHCAAAGEGGADEGGKI
jgi:hypothetical protein